MFGKSVSAYIISFFVFLRLLPSGRPKVLDLIGFIGWMSFIVGISTVSVYFYPIITLEFNKSIPGVFSSLASIIPVIQPLITLPSLSYLCLKNPSLVHKNQLPNPRYLMIFVFNAVLHLAFYSIFAYIFTTMGLKENSLIISLFYNGLWTLTMVLTSFVIGTSLEEFCKKISDTKYPSFKMIEDLSQDLKQLKMGLSPILFMMLTTKCILLINSSLQSLNQTTMPSYFFVSLMVATLWDLTYVVLVLDTTISQYKDLTLQLR